MTVTTTSVLSGPYLTNGATTAFPFSFKVYDKTDVRVFDVSNGVETDYDPSLYSVAIGDQGGSVAFTTPPASGAVLYIALSPSFTNNISFGIEEAFYPQGHNEGFDRSALRDQVLESAVERAFVVPLSPEARAAMAGKVPLVGPDGEPSFVGLSAIAPGAIIDALGTSTTAAPSQAAVNGGLSAAASRANFSHANTFPTTTLGAKLQKSVSPFDAPFNAVGDDVADDTAAVRACVNFCIASGYAFDHTGGVLRLTAPIAISAGLTIKGWGCIPYITAPGTRGPGCWFHIDHAGQGFTVSAAAQISGVAFERVGMIRNQSAPVSGWAPNANDYDIYINNADVKLRDVTLLNPTLGVYLVNGLYGRLDIDGLRGQAFQAMVRVSESYDVVRINNLHQWPFWHDDSNVHAYTRQNLDTIYSERNDNPQFSNIFSIFHRSALRFGQTAKGTTSKVKVSNADLDLGLYAVYVDSTVTSGITGDFTNVTYQSASGVSGSIGIYVAGNGSTLNFVNYWSAYSAQQGCYVGGTGNAVSFGGGVRISSYNQAGSGSAYPAFEAAAGNSIRIAGLPNVTSGGTGPRYGSTGAIYVDEWRTYTPTVTTTTGTLTTVSADGRFKLNNDSCSVIANVTVTANGTGAGELRVSMPFTANVSGLVTPLHGRAIGVSGKALQGSVTPGDSFARVYNYDNSYPASNGEILAVKAEYRV